MSKITLLCVHPNPTHSVGDTVQVELPQANLLLQTKAMQREPEYKVYWPTVDVRDEQAAAELTKRILAYDTTGMDLSTPAAGTEAEVPTADADITVPGAEESGEETTEGAEEEPGAEEAGEELPPLDGEEQPEEQAKPKRGGKR